MFYCIRNYLLGKNGKVPFTCLRNYLFLNIIYYIWIIYITAIRYWVAYFVILTNLLLTIRILLIFFTLRFILNIFFVLIFNLYTLYFNNVIFNLDRHKGYKIMWYFKTILFCNIDDIYIVYPWWHNNIVYL